MQSELDEELARFYKELDDPQAKRWNESPAQLFVDRLPRKYFSQYILPCLPKPIIRVCNLGIGIGHWDDFLGKELFGRGSLASVDFDKKICRVFSYRQKTENRPSPSLVICADIHRLLFANGIFDCITMIGTSHEISQAESAWREALRILKRERDILSFWTSASIKTFFTERKIFVETRCRYS